MSQSTEVYIYIYIYIYISSFLHVRLRMRIFGRYFIIATRPFLEPSLRFTSVCLRVLFLSSQSHNLTIPTSTVSLTHALSPFVYTRNYHPTVNKTGQFSHHTSLAWSFFILILFFLLEIVFSFSFIPPPPKETTTTNKNPSFIVFFLFCLRVFILWVFFVSSSSLLFFVDVVVLLFVVTRSFICSSCNWPFN